MATKPKAKPAKPVGTCKQCGKPMKMAKGGMAAKHTCMACGGMAKKGK